MYKFIEISCILTFVFLLLIICRQNIGTGAKHKSCLHPPKSYPLLSNLVWLFYNQTRLRSLSWCSVYFLPARWFSIKKFKCSYKLVYKLVNIYCEWIDVSLCQLSNPSFIILKDNYVQQTKIYNHPPES